MSEAEGGLHLATAFIWGVLILAVVATLIAKWLHDDHRNEGE